MDKKRRRKAPRIGIPKTRMAIMTKLKICAIAVVAVVACFFCCMIAGRILWHHLTAPSGSNVQVEARPIIEALNRYQKDHGAYPKALADLVPSYLPSLPKPPNGAAEWDYETGSPLSDRCSFGLTIRLPTVEVYYSSKKESWSYYDTGF